MNTSIRLILKLIPRIVAVVALLGGALLCWGLAEAGDAPPRPAEDVKQISLLDAIRLTLANNTTIKLAQQDVDISRGQLDVIRGNFDLTLTSSLSYKHSYDPLTQTSRAAYLRDFETTYLNTYQLSASKLLRNGVTLQPNLTVSRTANTLSYPDLPASQSKVAFAVVVPLLRGLGEEATGASERAAQLTVDSTVLDYFHSTAQTIYSTISSYWQLREYQMIVEVYADSEKRAADLLARSSQLVKGDQLPRSVLTNLRANMELKASQRLMSLTQLTSIRETLANNMGLADYGPQRLPMAGQDFPAPVDPASLSRVPLPKLKQMALANRADLKSAKLKLKSAQETLVAALDGLKPKLNMTLSLGYNGLSEEERYNAYYNSLSDNIYGPNTMVTLDFELPPSRTAAKGQVAASRASLKKAQLVVDDTTRRIDLGVAAAYNQVRSSAQQARSAKDSVDNYLKAVVDERMKLKLSTSTILNVIQVEDQLTSALLYDVYAKQNLSAALARLRYETGTLISGDPDKARFSLRSVSTLPNLEGKP